MVPQLVVAEVSYLLEARLGADAEVKFLGDLAAGHFVTEPVKPGDWIRIAELVAEYRDLPLGTVDASVVVAAERLGVAQLATASPRSEELPNEQVRIWPRSSRVEAGIRYRITVYTHCGLDYLLDFDGSFWDSAQAAPSEAAWDDPDDDGVITLDSENEAIYRSSKGFEFRLTRHPGPKAVYLCM